MPGKRNGDFRLGPNAEAILSGDLTGVQRALRQARRQNRLVEQYLTFKRPLPTDMPETYSLDSDEEAIVFLTYLSDGVLSESQQRRIKRHHAPACRLPPLR